MKIPILIAVVTIFTSYSCGNNGVESKTNNEALYKQRIQELEYGNMCCQSMIAYGAVEGYDSSVATFIRPSKYDKMTNSPVSNDSMMKLYLMYFPTIDSALRAENTPNGFGEFDKKMLEIQREKIYKTKTAEFEYKKTAGE